MRVVQRIGRVIDHNLIPRFLSSPCIL